MVKIGNREMEIDCMDLLVLMIFVLKNLSKLQGFLEKLSSIF